MIDLSVVIVSYNVCEMLANCLLSVRAASRRLGVEVFVVDNQSQDDTEAFVRTYFPDVSFIQTGANLGFAKANNIALARAKGRHLMILNPDTIVGERSFEVLVRYLDEHPDVGAIGPKVLDADGRFQKTSKRGLPTPWASFCKLSGLSKIFPRSKTFNSYEAGHLDPDEIHEIEVLYGAAMILRREAYERVGGLDEDYFMYGEDIAWGDAVRLAGWKLVYHPEAPIIHIKGESTRRSDIDRDRHFFGAMKIFVQKRFHPALPARLLIDAGISLALLLSRLKKHKKLLLSVFFLFLVYCAAAAPFALPRPFLSLFSAGFALITVGAMVLLRVRSHHPLGNRLFPAPILIPFLLAGSLLSIFVAGNVIPLLLCAVTAFITREIFVRMGLFVDIDKSSCNLPVVLVGALEKDKLTGKVFRVLRKSLETTGKSPVFWKKREGTVFGMLALQRELKNAGKMQHRVILTLAEGEYETVIRQLETTPLFPATVEFVDESLFWKAPGCVDEPAEGASG